MVAALCAATAVLLLVPGNRHRGRLGGGGSAPNWRRPPSADGLARSPAARTCLCEATSIVLGMLVAGPAGVVVGVPVGVAVSVWIGRLEPAAVVRERERVFRDLPLALELLAACSAVGRTPEQALPVVSRAVGGPLGRRFDEITARLSLGADAGAEWARLACDPLLADLGRAVQRCLESGAPLADGLARLAEDQRRERRTRCQIQARKVGVKAAAPLAACFLPAFMLVGVVPTVAGSVQRLFA